MNRCLYCYKEIIGQDSANLNYHERCSKDFYNTKTPPVLNYTLEDMFELAQKIVRSQKAVTGVQAKLSLSRKKISKDNETDRLTIVDLWGEYILKPQTKMYPELPEIEGLTMSLAQQSNIKTAPHSLIRLKSGELAYITKRVDRVKNRKLHMEDMCQLTERITEHKYKGSYEQIGKAIQKYASNPGFNLINYYELVLFCYLTGNNDMHLKNFSLLKNQSKEYNLCPAYDLVASELVVEGDDEDLALNLNGKKRKLKRKDFVAAMKTSRINDKAIENVFAKFKGMLPSWCDKIDISFLSPEMKEAYKEIIQLKFEKIY